MAVSETKILLKNYDIYDIVWLSTALLSMETYESYGYRGIMQYYFSEDEIIKKAKKLVGSKIEIETIRECSRNQKNMIINMKRTMMAQ